MMVWVATVPRPTSVPLEQIHVMLYSYFPAIQRGEGRPYVWRLLTPEMVGIVSAERPTCNQAKPIEIASGTTWHFRLTFKRVRNVGGTTKRPDGSVRKRQARSVTMDLMPDIRERLIRFAGERGGAIGYVRLDGMREMHLPNKGGEGGITIPMIDAEGQVYVTDPRRFSNLITGGGPGTGKAYGCGAWWLPELMGAT